MSFEFKSNTDAVRYLNKLGGYFNPDEPNGYFKCKFPDGDLKVHGYVKQQEWLTSYSFWTCKDLNSAMKRDNQCNNRLTKHRTYQTIDLLKSTVGLSFKGTQLAKAINQAGTNVFQISSAPMVNCGHPPAPARGGNPYGNPRRRCPSHSGGNRAPVVIGRGAGRGRPPRRNPAVRGGPPQVTGFNPSQNYGRRPKRNPNDQW